MKKKIFNFILLSALFSLIALSNCANNESKPETKTENTGNGANGPGESPAAEYPGNSSNSTSTTSQADSVQNK